MTGVPADGRCLFRAIAHVDCLRNGGEAPDENRQRELADELRAKVYSSCYFLSSFFFGYKNLFILLSAVLCILFLESYGLVVID